MLSTNVHSVVYCLDLPTGNELKLNNIEEQEYCLNLNEHFLFDGYCSYTIAQYLEDKASEGLGLLYVKEGIYHFGEGENASHEYLIEQVEPIAPYWLASIQEAA